MITELHDGTFYAEIELARDGGDLPDLVPAVRRHRPGGALRGAVPIFADEAVLDEAGVLFEQDEDEEDEEQIEQFREFLDQVRPEDFAHGDE